MKLKEFKSVVTKYKTVFFDAYGVLKNHKGIIPGVENTFKLLEDNGINYFILTNDASRSPELLAQIYLDYGISGMTPDKIISSGMLARDWLHLKIKSGTLAYMGTEQSAHYIQLPELETIAIKDVDLDALDDINAVVLLDDEGFDWNEELNKVITLLEDNPDVKIDIISYTDASGNESDNLELSKKRADEVKQFLASKDIKSERLSAIGLGGENPMKVDKIIAQKYTFLKVGDILTEPFIQRLMRRDQSTARNLNNRVEFNIRKE